MPALSETDASREEDTLRAKLEGHGLSLSEYATGGAKSLADLAQEIKENLCEVKEQVLADGRRRLRDHHTTKMRAGEEPQAALARALRGRLGLADADVSALLREADRGPEATVVEVEHASASYPGLQTRYSLHSVTICLDTLPPEAQKALLPGLGLPDGRPFLSVEGRLGAGEDGSVHLWRWVPTAAPAETVVAGEGKAAAFAKGLDPLLSQINGELCDLLQRLEEAKAAVRTEDASAELGPLADAPQIARRLLKRFSLLSSTARSEEDASGGLPMRGSTATAPTDGHRMSNGLRNFINLNFTGRWADEPHLPTIPSNDDLPQSRRASAPLGELPQSALRGARTSSGTLGGICEQRGEDKSKYIFSPASASTADVLRKEVAIINDSSGWERWELNVLDVAQRTGGKALPVIAEVLAVPLAQHLETDEETMRRFCSAVHGAYRNSSVPFHNEAHGATVGHSCHWVHNRSGAWAVSDGLERAAVIIAALAHDVGHFGLNNIFLSVTGHELAILYNDRSVLENMHAATCFQLMQAPERNVLKALTRDQRKQFRSQAVDLVLATDMASHFDFLSQFRDRVEKNDIALTDGSSKEELADRRLLGRACIKCADLGHAALAWELHERWTLRIHREFYAQGDLEKRSGLPISPAMDRTIPVVELCSSQKGFLGVVILPLWKELAAVSDEQVRKDCVATIESNVERWGRGEVCDELRSLHVEREEPTSPKDASALVVPGGPAEDRHIASSAFCYEADSGSEGGNPEGNGSPEPEAAEAVDGQARARPPARSQARTEDLL